MTPKPTKTAARSIGILLFIGALTGVRAQSTYSDQLDRPMKVCEVLDDLDKLNGKTISIVGYLDGSILEGLALKNDHPMKSCAGGGLTWFRWPGALGISLVPTVPAELARLLDKNGLAFRARVRVKATIKAKFWRYIFCIGGSCISHGYGGHFAGSLHLVEITALPEHKG